MRRLRLPCARWLPLPLLLLGAAACSPGAGPERVVVVTIDTLRADRVGCYGDARARTPHLDALAADGVRFARAIAPTPLTLPSHASLWTGLPPPRHGVRDNAIFRLPDDVPTAAERFREAGFATAAFVSSVVLDHRYGLARGFEVYDDDLGEARRASATGYAERPADRTVDAALAWLERAPDHFLLWVHLYDPHADYAPPPGFAAAFPDDPYRGEVAFADAQVGRLLDGVAARHRDGRTLVVVTSDHGESLGEHGEHTHSLTLYDATQHVPLLLRGPGVDAGRTEGGVVGLVDVAPTLLALAGLPPLDDAPPRSLLNPDPERRVYLETLAPQIGFGWSPLLGLRSERWKYVRAPRPELYDLGADPTEEHDLATARPERVRALDAALAARLHDARVAPAAAFDAERQGQLEALGYVLPAGGADAMAAAGARLGEVGGIDPKDALPMVEILQRATTLLSEDRPAEAYALLAPLEGGGYEIEQARALAALELGRIDEAERRARHAVAQGPGFASPHLVLGHALLRQGRLDDAEAVFARAAALDPHGDGPRQGLAKVRAARSARGAPEPAAD